MATTRTHWTLYLWPGLPQLWLQGKWSGLAVTLFAAAALNASVAVSFGWSDWLGSGVRTLYWAVFAVAWSIGVIAGAIQLRKSFAHEVAEGADDPFRTANELYLQGDLFAAEKILNGLLRRNARDADARLRLASVLRRMRRLGEAKNQLDRLERLETADKWRFEIQEERKRLLEACSVASEGSLKLNAEPVLTEHEEPLQTPVPKVA